MSLAMLHIIEHLMVDLVRNVVLLQDNNCIIMHASNSCLLPVTSMVSLELQFIQNIIFFMQDQSFNHMHLWVFFHAGILKDLLGRNVLVQI